MLEEYVRTNVTRDLAVWATSFILSLAQWRHVVLFFGNSLQGIVQAEQGILDGYPHWRLVQSRVLGPWIEKLLTLLFGFDLSIAHMIVAIAALSLCGLVMFYAGRAIAGRQSGWSALLAFHLLFALMMVRPWLYIYDYFVLLTAAVFMLLVIRDAPWWSFLLLMGVAFLNHDSALAIGVWMVVKALVDSWAERRRPDWGMFGGGVLGSLGGALLVEYIRRILLKGETGAQFIHSPTYPLEPYYFFVKLPGNLRMFYHSVVRPYSEDLEVVIWMPLILTIALAVILIVRQGVKALPLASYALSHIAALLLFAVISETRALLQLVPFMSLAGMLAANPNWDASSGVKHERVMSS
jgi:hypothetical protein